MNEKLALLEAALFLSAEPLSINKLAEVLGLGSPGYVQKIIDALKEELKKDSRGLELIENNGKYELKVKSSLIDKVAHLAPDQDISSGTLRTLSLIAYETPIEQSKVIEIRGNRAYYQIQELKERGFVKSEKKGRTNVLSVTKNFLDYFGLETPEEFKMHIQEMQKKQV